MINSKKINFIIVSDAHHLKQDDELVAYAPYVKEMDLWLKKVDQATIIAPTRYSKPLLTQAFKRQDVQIKGLRRLEFHKLSTAVLSLITIPYQFVILCLAFAKADHIHLRCPGNLALLACIVQVLFPSKKKTVKYAGNWDPKANQPLAYRWQKKILSNTWLTKNMQVLVYGDWSNQTKNIKLFFTATYRSSDRLEVVKEIGNPLKIIFVGTLTPNKHPDLLLDLAEQLNQSGILTTVDFYGDGLLLESLRDRGVKIDQKYQALFDKSLGEKVLPIIKFHRNQPGDVVKTAYKKSDFLFLASQSEGWPKVVAEAMWHGCVPIATPVSCIPWMLNRSEGDELGVAYTKVDSIRGLLYQNITNTVNDIKWLTHHPEAYKVIAKNASAWSQQYTLDRFEKEIKKLV